MPLGNLLVRPAALNGTGFIKVGGYQLEADGGTVGRLAAGERYGGVPAAIEGAGKAQYAAKELFIGAEAFHGFPG